MYKQNKGENKMTKLQELINDLSGTCFSLEESLERCNLTEDEKTSEQLDQYIFQCEECGIWCDISEKHNMHDSIYCTNCAANYYEN